MTSSTKWVPNEAVLRELSAYLRHALNPRDLGAQKHATLVSQISALLCGCVIDVFQMLTQAKSKPETARYLTYIYSNGPLVETLGVQDSQLTILRSSAAINLKNVIKSHYKNIDEESRTYIRSSVLVCLSDADSQVRALTGTVITEIIQKGGILGWPDLLPTLLSIASNDAGNVSNSAQEASVSALVKICEDRKDDLEQDYHGQRPLHFMLPRLMELLNNKNAQVRANAIACISAFVPQQPDILVQSLDTILNSLFRLAADEDSEVRQHLCRAFVLVIDIRPDKMVPHMEGLVDYMCVQQKDTEEPEAALEAAEFWLAVSENDQVFPHLEPYLRKIIPVLLESMVYDEDSIIRLSGAAEDAALEDHERDIKPIFAASKTRTFNTNGNASTQGGREEGEVDVDDDDADDGEVDEQWNLRKCSAAALDVLASKFQQLVFEIAMEYLDRNLTNAEWPYRESAVLAMGAIAEGCMVSVAPSLPTIIPYLTSLLNDSEPSVRLITCWALGRYSAWALNIRDMEQRQQYFNAILNGILDRMLDKVKSVQTAAASAFANIGEKAGKELAPHSLRIVQTFVACFDSYKARNMYILYDCVQTLADQVGGTLRNPDIMSILMSATIARWQKLPNDSQELFPLHECLSFIATALRDAFAPFAVPIFSRCVTIIRQNLEQLHTSESDMLVEKPNKDFLVTSLDLLSSIIQALRPEQTAELVQTSQPRVFDLLIYCMRDAHYDVRQSAYALLGDCAVNIFPQLHPSLPVLIPEAIQQLDLASVKPGDTEAALSVINNACWSLGEIAMRYSKEMKPYADTMYRKSRALLDEPAIPTSVAENVVIAIGRLGVHLPSVLSPYLADFINQFLRIIAPVESNEEKGQAYLGLNRIIMQNPYAVTPSLLLYLNASLEYNKGSTEAQDQGETIGQMFNQVSDHVWAAGLRW